MARRPATTQPNNADDTPYGTGEYRSGPVAGTALISGVTFANKGVVYADVDGLAIFEGDIILGTVAAVRAAAETSTRRMVESVGITGAQYRWPNATIPYDIDPALPNQQRITDAIAHWQANTRIRLVPRTAQHQDYVHFMPGGGCSSHVGRQFGRQDIILAGGCDAGRTIHEIGHAVGLWHEQSREDRDTFVQIVWANIPPNRQHNFVQHITDGDDLGPYDYGSIMHYEPDAFSINGQPTIIALQPLPPGVVMGQRVGLSQGDIDGVHMLYPGGAITIKELPKDPAREPVTIKEIRKDPAREPVTIKEIRKDPISEPVTFKEIRKDPIIDPGPGTFKEIRKEPVLEPGTIKEVGRDPIGGTFAENVIQPGPGGGFGPGVSPSPFVLASPSRAGGGLAEAVAEAGAQVQQLAEALLALEQQQAELLAAYDAAVQTLEALEQGQI